MGRGQNVGLILPYYDFVVAGASVFHKHMSSLILHLYIYPYAPTKYYQFSDKYHARFMCMGFTKLCESSGNRTSDLLHRKLKISLDHLVTLTDDEMCIKIL